MPSHFVPSTSPTLTLSSADEAMPDAMFRRTLSPEAEFVNLGARTHLRGARSARFDELLQADSSPLNRRLNDSRQVGLNWPAVLALSQNHRVTGLLGRHLSARGWRGVPRPIALSWGRFFGSMTLHSATLSNELGRVTQVLEDAGIPVVSFKGPTLAHTAYGNGAVRPSADLDVLVSRSQVQRAHELLRARGYAHEAALSPVQERAHLRVDSVFNLSRPAPEELAAFFPEGFALELHWAITSPCLPFDLTFEDLAPRLGWMELPGLSGGPPTRVRTLAPPDLLLILAVHGAKHLWERLLWLCDIAQLLEQTPDLDWDALLRAARARGIERMTALALALTRDVMGAVLPREVETWLSGQPQALRLASRLRSSLLSYTLRLPEDVENNVFWSEMEQHQPILEANSLLAQAIDSPWKRAGFFWHLATTPSAIERAQVSLPGGFEPLWWVLGPVHALQNRWRRFEQGR